MIIKERIVRVSDTDCTKNLYFTSLLKFTQEAFEDHLREQYQGVYRQFSDGVIALPIVQADATFFLPIKVGDILQIQLEMECKNTSFIVKGLIFHQGVKKGEVTIFHVCKEVASGKSLSCKEVLRSDVLNV